MTLNRVIDSAAREDLIEDSHEIAGDVLHELRVGRLGAAANFLGHGTQHGSALGLIVPKPLNACGDHGAHRPELASLHRRLGEGVMLVDK